MNGGVLVCADESCSDIFSVRFELRNDVRVFGELSSVKLGVDHLPISDDIKDASASFDQLSFNTCRTSNRIRQTDGIGGVVSLDAVRNRNVHAMLLWKEIQDRSARRLLYCRGEVNAESLVRTPGPS